MCGIAGIVDFAYEVNKSDVKAMCDHLYSRGPDAEGYYLNGHVGLGHCRLSIIDLITGDQPMHDVDNKLVIVFNGLDYQSVNRFW